MSDLEDKPSEDTPLVKMWKQIAADYAVVCSSYIDEAVRRYGFTAMIKDLQKALEAGHKRRTYNAGGGR